MANGIAMAESTVEDIDLMRTKLAYKESWFRGIAGGNHWKLDWHAALDLPAEALTRAARPERVPVGPHDQSAEAAVASGYVGLGICSESKEKILEPHRILQAIPNARFVPSKRFGFDLSQSIKHQQAEIL